MANELFSDWEELTTAISGKITEILKDNIAPVAEDILKKHIKSDIYDAYSPKENGWVNGTTYKRRHVLEDQITTLFQNENTILITSTATASPSILKGWSFHNRYPGAFLKMIEVGDMGIWRSGFPRPAVTNAQNEIDKNEAIKNAVKDGIKQKIGNYTDI